MACDMQCATSKNYDSAWEFYGPNWSSLGSHYFEVGADPVILTVVGLEDGQCIRFEQVFGCGSGDTFVPYAPECCPLVVCLPTTSVVISQSGRYRMVLDGEPEPDPRLITVYGRPQRVPPGYGGLSMAQCCPTSHAPAVISSLDGVVHVVASGTDGQTFTLDFQPLLAASELAGDPLALGVLCSALTPCVQSLIPSASSPVTVVGANSAIPVSGGPNYIVSFDPVAAAVELTGNAQPLSILCSALTPCMQALIPPTSAPVTVVGANSAVMVSSGPNYIVSFDPVAAAVELTGNAQPLSILCSALTPCMQALIPPTGPVAYAYFTSPTSSVIIGGSSTANVTLDIDPVTTASLIAQSPAAVGALCTALTPCIAGQVHPPVSITSGTPDQLAVSASAAQSFSLSLNISTLPEVVNPLASNAPGIITNAVMREALMTGQNFPIFVTSTNSPAGYFLLTGALDYSAVIGVQSQSTGTGHGVAGWTNGGSGSGHAVYAQVTNSQTTGSAITGTLHGGGTSAADSAIHAQKAPEVTATCPALRVTNLSAYGYGALIDNYSGAQGLLVSQKGAAEAVVATGLNGAYDVATFGNFATGTGVDLACGTASGGPTVAVNVFGAVSASGGFITSDARLKTAVSDVQADVAIKFADAVRFVEYTKTVRAPGMKTPLQKAKDDAAERLGALKKAAARAESDLASASAARAAVSDSADAALSLEADNAVQAGEAAAYRAKTELANAENILAMPEPDPISMRQAGVIAQEIAAITKKLGAFEYLVTTGAGGMLQVDYISLYAIMAFAERERSRRLESRLAKLGG